MKKNRGIMKENTSSFYDSNSGHLVVVSAPNAHYYPDDELDDIFTKKLLIGCSLILLIVFAYLVILSIWYGNKFGKPLLHTMSWLKNIAGGKYEEPVSKKGKPVRFRRSGKEKWLFRIFKDVTNSLEHLSITLKKNDAMRKVLQQTREEWITGLTHQCKTPLSSIYGYALLLESKQYNWTDQSIEQFGHVMKEKSQYMTTLIDDLSLTYQLKNDTLPAQHVNVEINQFVRKVLLQFTNNPTLQNQNIEFVPSSSKIQYFIEEKWFQRIIENLLANAVKHNNETTNVIVKLSQNANSLHYLFQIMEKVWMIKRKNFYSSDITEERIQKKATSEQDLVSPLQNSSFMPITERFPLIVNLEKERRLYLYFHCKFQIRKCTINFGAFLLLGARTLTVNEIIST